MGNGLIVAFVVVVWAAYFVPLAVRRYDEASKSGSIDKFSSLSRVITHKKAAVEPEITVIPEAVGEDAGHTATVVKTVTRAAARRAARRRRRTLLTLLALTAVVGGVAGFAVISAWWISAPGGLIAAWLVACRVQVRGERGIGRTKRTKPASKASADEYDADATVIISHQFEDIEPDRRHVMQDVPLAADALDEQLVIAVPVAVTTGAAVWDPLPVTLPTYVTKPRAGRTVRTIEFGEPGAWTSGHIEGEDVTAPAATAASDGNGENEQRQAVGH